MRAGRGRMVEEENGRDPQTTFNFFLILPRLGPRPLQTLRAQVCATETPGPFCSRRRGSSQAAKWINFLPGRVHMLCVSYLKRQLCF